MVRTELQKPCSQSAPWMGQPQTSHMFEERLRGQEDYSQKEATEESSDRQGHGVYMDAARANTSHCNPKSREEEDTRGTDSQSGWKSSTTDKEI